MTHLAQLFKPMTIGRMRIQNRIMMPGMSAGMMLDGDAEATPEMIAYYIERARTRPGLMAIGASSVVPASAPRKMPLALDHDRHIPSLAKLVDAVAGPFASAVSFMACRRTVPTGSQYTPEALYISSIIGGHSACHV